MEYFENVGGAVAQLYWSSPSIPKAIIPQGRLYSRHPLKRYPTVRDAGGLEGDVSPTDPAFEETLSPMSHPGKSAGDPMAGMLESLASDPAAVEVGPGAPSAPGEAGTVIPVLTSPETRQDLRSGFFRIAPNAGDVPLDEGAGKPPLAANDGPKGDGLEGAYFTTIDLSGPSRSRVDAVVNFDWGTESPGFGDLGADRFSIRWTGRVEALFTETYRFCTGSDDGVRLWVNRELLVDQWVDQALAEWCGSIDLQAGRKYDITMEYYENEAGAGAQLYWSSPSIPRAVIPRARLYSTTR
jgi:hypothetical protein